MSFIEKHVTNEFGKERTDFSAAISFEMFNSLIEKISKLKDIRGGSTELNEAEKIFYLWTK